MNLRLTYRRPCDVAAALSFLRLRAVPGVEGFDGAGFLRALDLPHGTATVRLSEGPPGGGYVKASLRLRDLRDLTVAVARCRRLLDLDADPVAVDTVLGGGPLAGHVKARPGLRVPGTVDGAEIAIRAVLGQQISVAGARTLAGRLAATYGQPLGAPCGPPDSPITHTFARPDELAKADPADLPMPASRARALIELCGALAVGDLVLDGSAERGDVEHRLLAMRGIGPWTAGYIRMRALRDPDVWLGTDLEVVRALARLPGADPAQWSPWRSYAVLQLWSGGPA